MDVDWEDCLGIIAESDLVIVVEIGGVRNGGDLGEREGEKERRVGKAMRALSHLDSTTAHPARAATVQQRR